MMKLQVEDSDGNIYIWRRHINDEDHVLQVIKDMLGYPDAVLP